MDGGRSEFSRPASLALMAIAAVGWLVAIYFWAQAVDLARRRRGSAAPRGSRASAARRRIAEFAADRRGGRRIAQEARRRPQGARRRRRAAHRRRRNDLSELTRKVDETELALASETDEVEFEDRAPEGYDDEPEDHAGRTRRSAVAEVGDQRRTRQGAHVAGRGAGGRRAPRTLRRSRRRRPKTESRAKADEIAKAAAAAKAQLDDLQAKIDAARKDQPPPK